MIFISKLNLEIGFEIKIKQNICIKHFIKFYLFKKLFILLPFSLIKINNFPFLLEINKLNYKENNKLNYITFS
jgi:hypothetical protein